MRVAVRAATSGSARHLSAQTGAHTAMTAVSELVLANFSAVVRLMKPKPYESSNIPATTPPAPVHREGFTTSQLILIRRSSGLRKTLRTFTEWNLSKIAQSRKSRTARQGPGIGSPRLEVRPGGADGGVFTFIPTP